MDRSRLGRQDRLIKQKRNDAYQEKRKLRDCTVCTRCGSVYEGGRWTWNETGEECLEATCPACQRIQDKYPAGFVQIRGAFFREHQDEILNLVRNVDRQQKNERPLERIMDIEEGRDNAMVTTTGVHIARRIGDALHSSYSGDLNYHYEEDNKRIRVHWERE
ncbi:MAG: ATPase [bacterium]|nr:MAG: ATPase [bacterium]